MPPMPQPAVTWHSRFMPLDTETGGSEVRVALDSVSVVVRGAFNPALFTPAWFRDADLIGRDEFDDSHIELITADFSTFRMGWLNFHASRDSLQLQTEAVEEFPRLRDAAIGILRRLEHYPVSVLGINRDTHTMVESMDSLHSLGDALAPKRPWVDFLEVPGVRSIAMWGARSDGWRGKITVRVEPSVAFSPAAFISVNDHYELIEDDNNHSTRGESYGSGDQPVDALPEKLPRALEILNQEWAASMERAALANVRLLSLAGDD